jgi:hypothetical protein
MQKRAPGTTGSPQEGQTCCNGSAQLMQKRPAAGVGSPQAAQIRVVSFMPPGPRVA